MTHPGGRPTIMTQDTINKLESVFAIGGTDLEACSYANISHQTLYNYQEDHPEFVERKQMLKEKPFIKARQTVVQALSNPRDAQWFLERKRKGEFAVRVESTGADGKDLIPDNDAVIQELTDKLNDLYKSTDGEGDGEPSSPVGDKE
jgi:hypothetical protein